jgi:hypothetical protein
MIESQLEMTTDSGAREICEFLGSLSLFVDRHVRERVFRDPMSAYHALRAYREGQITLEQFATFQIHLHICQHKREAIVEPLFLEDQSPNVRAVEYLKRSIDTDLCKYFSHRPHSRSLSLNPSMDEIDAIVDRARHLPASEQVILVFVDEQKVKPPAVEGASPLIRTVSQAVARTGLTFGNRTIRDDGRIMRLKLSLGIMNLAVDVKRVEGSYLYIRPVIGLSSREDIYSGQREGWRDMAIPFPGVEMPSEADGLPAPVEDGDFTDHDFYHAMVLAFVPRQQADLCLNIYKQLPGSHEQATQAEQNFANPFLDLELVGARAPLNQYDQVVKILQASLVRWITVWGPGKGPGDVSSCSEKGDLLPLPEYTKSVEFVGKRIRELSGCHSQSVETLCKVQAAFESEVRKKFPVPPADRRTREWIIYRFALYNGLIAGWRSAQS